MRVNTTESMEESSNGIRHEPTVQVEGHLPENNYQIKTCMNSTFLLRQEEHNMWNRRINTSIALIFMLLLNVSVVEGDSVEIPHTI